MEKFTVLIEARPFCAFDNSPMEQLEKSGMDLIDMRGSGMDKYAKTIYNCFVLLITTTILLGMLTPGTVLGVKLPNQNPPGPVYIPDQIIVKYKKGIKPEKIIRLMNRASAGEEKR